MTRDLNLLSMFRRNAAVVVALLVVFGLSAIAQGQSITGTLVGTITDQQGAAVSSATVKATNVDTGIAHSALSNAQGEYRIEYLAVGHYTVEVQASNFETFLQKNVSLTVDQTQRVDVALHLGAVQETVTVSTAPPLVNTSSAELGRTVDPTEIIGMPLVNRNVLAEISLTPGVQSNSASPSSNPSGTPNFQIGVPSVQVVVNGGIDGGVPMVSYYLDGGENMTGLRNYGNPLPNPDAIEEFRMETNNFSAEYGRMSGAVVTAVTKSGTNQLHGSLFEFNRNTDLNATPWNSKVNAPYHRNQFGGTAGGPVKRDKAFFFGSYAGLRQSVGSQLSGGVMPTTLERQGDFTQSKVIPNAPGTATPIVGTNSSSNCSVPTVGCIPYGLLDHTAANLISKFVPLPNSGGNAYVGYFTGPTTQNEFLGKYDEALSEKNHLGVSYFYLNTLQNAFGTGNIPYSTNQSFARQQNADISEVHTMGSASANQAWLSFTRVAGGRVNLPATSLGALGSSFTIQGASALPQIIVSGYFTAGGALAGAVSDTDFYSVRDVVSTTKGRHALNFGGEASLEHDMFVGNLDNFGIFTFTSTTPGSTGNAMADLVTGKVGTMEQDTPYAGLFSNWYYSLFVQDTYHIAPRLTVNLGLRYDLQTPFVESRNHIATFVPNVQSTTIPSAPKGLLFPGDAGVTRGIVPTQNTHFSPRIGIAWDPFGDGKTAIRAGAGLFYGSTSANEWSQASTGQPFAIRQVFSSITSLTDVYSNPASFPNGDPFPYNFNPASPRFLPAASVLTIAENYKWPLVYQINATVERQLPGEVSVSAAYVATLTHHVPFMIDANTPVWSPGATTSQASINSRRPYDPGVLGQTVLTVGNQTASYHSLQISAHRPLTHNLMLNGFYVLSKSFLSADGAADGFTVLVQDFYALANERGLSDSDQKHTASVSGIWNLDYYRGSSSLLKEAANGWTISSIISMDSGYPVNILTGVDKNADSFATDRPNRIAGQHPFSDSHRSRSAAAAAWFNTAAFTANGPGLGIGPNGIDGTTPHNFLRAPGYRDVDLGIFRDIGFERGINLQIRGEATNAFNLVSLNAPTANLASPLDGKITSATSPRLIQLGMRLSF
jgi:hypothetical protein